MANTYLFLGLLLMVATITALPCEPQKRAEVTWLDCMSDYPEEEAETMLNTLIGETNSNILSNEQFLEIFKHKMDDKNKIHNTNITFTNLCPSTTRKIFPRGVLINNKQYYVLNPKSRPCQYIETEICDNDDNDGQPSAIINPQVGYTTECIQEYVTRTVYLLTIEKPVKLVKKSVPIPSCCSCFLKRT